MARYDFDSWQHRAVLSVIKVRSLCIGLTLTAGMSYPPHWRARILEREKYHDGSPMRIGMLTKTKWRVANADMNSDKSKMAGRQWVLAYRQQKMLHSPMRIGMLTKTKWRVANADMRIDKNKHDGVPMRVCKPTNKNSIFFLDHFRNIPPTFSTRVSTAAGRQPRLMYVCM